MNNVSLVGRLTKDPEKRTARNGTSCCLFQLAVGRGVKTQSGETIVDFIPCSAWAMSSDYLCKYAKKGDMLAVSGKITTRTSQEPNGLTRFIVEVLVSGLAILNPKPQQQQQTQVQEEEDNEGLPF